jgi:hypothetical protein
MIGLAYGSFLVLGIYIRFNPLEIGPAAVNPDSAADFMLKESLTCPHPKRSLTRNSL